MTVLVAVVMMLVIVIVVMVVVIMYVFMARSGRCAATVQKAAWAKVLFYICLLRVGVYLMMVHMTLGRSGRR